MKRDWFMEFILRSPLHGLLSRSVILLTVTGRKTGNQITLPVSYYEDGKYLWVMSKRDRTWWRNIKAHPQVTIRLRGQDFSAHGEVILDDAAVFAQLDDYLGRYPRLARHLQVSDQDQAVRREDLARETQIRMFVRFELQA